jgi:hypothetical protein
MTAPNTDLDDLQRLPTDEEHAGDAGPACATTTYPDAPQPRSDESKPGK